MVKGTDNYRLQVEGAKKYFLRYDQEKLIEKLKLKADADWLYTRMLGREYRIHRKTGAVERREVIWAETNEHGDVMTLLDLVCDSREDRFCSGNWVNMSNFGAMFHRSLLEEREDPFARAIQDHPADFCRACEALGGTPGPSGDISYALEVFEDLKVLAQFWEEDEDFPPQVRWMWDANALMYLKYETMWYALGMLQKEILRRM